MLSSWLPSGFPEFPGSGRRGVPSIASSTIAFSPMWKNRHFPFRLYRQISRETCPPHGSCRTWQTRSPDSATRSGNGAQSRCALRIMTAANVPGLVITRSSRVSGPGSIMWTLPRHRATGPAHALPRCGCRPRLMGISSCVCWKRSVLLGAAGIRWISHPEPAGRSAPGFPVHRI